MRVTRSQTWQTFNDDANFCAPANSAILRLTKKVTWVSEVLATTLCVRADEPLTAADQSFENDPVCCCARDLPLPTTRLLIAKPQDGLYFSQE
jgi:hypothetical protein